ncbi:unnamed protein product [Adineta steineri]|uniref:Uncharacterized protein n=1 Tax=Adineta steineri TaxID=433720 RepID=A0A814IWR1_9BILA|nr:unnamed protein product [Adineta steineri]CAF1029315.1 unnamed protein product [Adineta steineri]CAF1033806.1 unnamed protein product [Adineta steineri]CAF3590609.1 unnamed protein product [Adineta steineri]CAF4066875.1 unnamed protein product [Adineta steineri]
MSTAQAEGSLAKMASDQTENSQTSTGDSYTQAIINKDQSEQRKEDGSSGIFLIKDQKNMESTDEKDKTNKK